MVVDVSAFMELSIVLVIVALISIVMRLIKQPLVIGYILAGIIASPLFLGLIHASETLETFSHIGIAFLLFLVGLHLNPKFVKDVGGISLVTGLGQVIFTFIGGFVIGYVFGFSTLTSAYISIALTFSSTIIIMKLLSDKNDLESLYGKISIGFLLVQDLVVILLLMVLSSLEGGGSFTEIALSALLKGGGLLVVFFVVSNYVLPRLDSFIGSSQEFLFVFAVGWCFALAAIFEYFGFSIETGALVAGITLSLSPMHYQITARVKPLRDFFLILFFVFLGTQMEFSNVSQFIIPIIVFSLFVLIGNPLIVMIIMGLAGYSKRNGFLVSTAIAQISEFSFILVALGVSLGHLEKDILSLVTMVGLITIAGSTYFMMYSDRLYSFSSKFLSVFEFRKSFVDTHAYQKKKAHEVLLLGHNRVGYDILKPLKKAKKSVLVVDFNPDTILRLAKEHVDCRYGDVGDVELLNDLNFRGAKMAISTIPDLETNLLLLHHIRERNKRCIIIVMAHQIGDALRLYESGATYVLLPHFLGGKYVAAMIDNYGFSLKKFMKEQFQELDHLNKRKQHHDHPVHESG
jgi:Kef-type K+ transport system membrane component KefB